MLAISLGTAIVIDPLASCPNDLLLKMQFQQIGITAGISLTVFLLLGFGAISSLFTNDSEVLEIAKSGTLVRIYY